MLKLGLGGSIPDVMIGIYKETAKLKFIFTSVG